MAKPLILVIPGREELHTGYEYRCRSDYLVAIENCGGIPVMAAYSRVDVLFLLKLVSGVMILGGDFDIHPRWYGENPLPGLGRVNWARTKFELFTFQRALLRGLPILGICGGMQLINVALGGTLYQDVGRQCPGTIDHRGDPGFRHKVFLEKGSRIAGIMRVKSLRVNSTHHQAVKDLGRGLRVGAYSPDGIVEAIEGISQNFLLGVQWHPERMKNSFSQGKIFIEFIKAANKRNLSRRRASK